MGLGTRPARPSLVTLQRKETRRRQAASPAIWWFLVATLVFSIATSQLLSEAHNVDRVLLFGLRTPFNHEGWVVSKRLSDVAHNMSALGSPEVAIVVTAVVIGFLLLARQRWGVLFLLVSAGGGAVFAFLLKSVFGALRPHHGPGPAFEILNTSFPRGHTMLAALVYLSCAAVVAHTAPKSLSRPLAIYAFAVGSTITGAVAVSRVLLAVHWPSDVFAGIAAGASWVGLCWIVSKRLYQARRCDETSVCRQTLDAGKKKNAMALQLKLNGLSASTSLATQNRRADGF